MGYLSEYIGMSLNVIYLNKDMFRVGGDELWLWHRTDFDSISLATVLYTRNHVYQNYYSCDSKPALISAHGMLLIGTLIK